MAPPSNEFLKSEVERLTSRIGDIVNAYTHPDLEQRSKLCDDLKIPRIESPPSPESMLLPTALYKDKTAQEWCEAYADAQETIERLSRHEVSPGQALANIMASGRA